MSIGVSLWVWMSFGLGDVTFLGAAAAGEDCVAVERVSVEGVFLVAGEEGGRLFFLEDVRAVSFGTDVLGFTGAFGRYFRDGQDNTALEKRGILSYPIPFILLRDFLTNFPGGWCCIFRRLLFWLNRTARINCFYGFSWQRDKKGWPIGHVFFRISWEGFLSEFRCFLLSTLRKFWVDPKEGLGAIWGTH